MESLLVAWLEESIYRLAAHREVLAGARFFAAAPNGLTAALRWRRLAADEKPLREVKAATYHGLRVLRRDGRYSATLILDV